MHTYFEIYEQGRKDWQKEAEERAISTIEENGLGVLN